MSAGSRSRITASVGPLRSASSSVTTTGTPRAAATPVSHPATSRESAAAAASSPDAPENPGWASMTISTESARSIRDMGRVCHRYSDNDAHAHPSPTHSPTISGPRSASWTCAPISTTPSWRSTVPGTYGSILDTLRHLVDGDVFYLDVLRGGEPESFDKEASIPDIAGL